MSDASNRPLRADNFVHAMKCANMLSLLLLTFGNSCSSVLEDIIDLCAAVLRVRATGTLSMAMTAMVCQCGIKLHAK